MPSPSVSRWTLPRAVVTLGWISLFTDVASEMLYPVAPLFLTAALGVPVVAVGIVEGAAEALVSVLKGLSGWHSDRIGRRLPYIRWGYGLSAAAKPFMALAFSWPAVLLARAADRLGKGLRTSARDAFIADAVDPAHGGRAYGFHRMMDTAGALAGVLLAAGLLALLPGQYRLVFLASALPGLAAVGLTLRLRESRKQPPCASANPSPRPDAGSLAGLPSAYWMALGPLMLFAFANSSDALLILRARDLGLTDVQCILAYALFNLVYALCAYPLGALSDRMGRWPLLMAGWTVYAGVYLGFALLDPAALWWLFPLYGLFMAANEGVGRALIRDRIPDGRQGAAMGLFHMAYRRNEPGRKRGRGMVVGWPGAGGSIPPGRSGCPGRGRGRRRSSQSEAVRLTLKALGMRRDKKREGLQALPFTSGTGSPRSEPLEILFPGVLGHVQGHLGLACLAGLSLLHPGDGPLGQSARVLRAAHGLGRRGRQGLAVRAVVLAVDDEEAHGALELLGLAG